MKRLDRYILGRFMAPFAASFSTTLVILVIQFLSRYQEDILGKGFPLSVMAELFFYASASLVLLALPMGLLMAGLMTMGNLGERLELTALLSAGVPFWRILLPLGLFGLGSLLLAGWLSWELIPLANLKLYTLLYDMEQAKPALALKPGLFNRWIEGYALRIGKIREEKKLEEVLLYEYAPDGSVERTILADSGEVVVDKENLLLRFMLVRGCQYETRALSQEAPAWVRSCFDTLYLRIDISSLGLHRSDEKLFAGHQYMLSRSQLRLAIDSLRGLLDSSWAAFRRIVHSKMPLPRKIEGISLLPADRGTIENLLRQDKSQAEYYIQQQRNLQETLWRYELEWYYKYAYPLSTVVFLMLGAGLGGVIRKGGIGMPLVVSTAIFILSYVLNAQGKKLAREGILSPEIGAFLPLIVIAPITMYLVLLVTTEARWLYADFWSKKLRKWRVFS